MCGRSKRFFFEKKKKKLLSFIFPAARAAGPACQPVVACTHPPDTGTVTQPGRASRFRESYRNAINLI
jgi:hypothetical protein